MMVTTGGETEGAEYTLLEASPAVNAYKPNEDGESEYIIPVEEAENDGYEEVPDIVECSKVTNIDNGGDNLLVTEMNNDNKAEREPNTYEDDEIDGHHVITWANVEDDEENNADEDEISEDDDGYEVSAKEASEEEEDDDDEDEDNGEKATEASKGNETEAKANEDGTEAKAKEDGTEAKAKEDVTEAKSKEDGTEAKRHDGDKVEAGFENGKTPNKRIRKKKGPVDGSKKLESGHKPESSVVKKGKKKNKVESMGMIFMCSSKTKDDCFQYRVLGLPESKKDMVGKIYGGMRLFLYDLDLKLMYGIYKAAGPGGYNIEPKAFKSQFPSQVRFTVLDDCLPLPEEKFKKVIKENYFTKTKFDCKLKSEQVKKLCKLFVESSKRNPSKKSRRTRKPEKPQPVRQEISKKRRVVDGRHQESRYRERPRKLPRHEPLTAPLPLPAPLPSTAPLYAYERPSDRRDHQYNPYTVRRDPSPVTRRELYTVRRDPSPVTRRDLYRDGHDSYPERDYPSYRGGRDSYVERRDPYRDGQDTYPRRNDPYVDGRVSYLERRDPYVDGRGLYLDRRDPYSEPYDVGSYRRDPLLDQRDAYREDGGGREGVLERGYVRVLDFDTRYRSEIGSRDSYVLNQGRPLYGDRIYPEEYPSRGAGLAREYRL
ncbi:hypothetical protein CASFOL_030397 [Castilleja foliolosa]|uniref:DCD domain-containing protein n=1 Tax=Castilleja foliolosa TaxID=1961234 RepID=A0ABD3C7W4_9LAMI